MAPIAADPPVSYREKLLRSTEPGLVALAKLSTVQDANRPPSVRTLDIFQKKNAAIDLPLNRKTTENEVRMVPLGELEPNQDLIPVQGLEVYVVRSRRDPPDVAHVVHKDGRERWIIQEGHTRLGAAILRGEKEREARVWEFVEDEAGRFEPVPRGLHKRGLGYRDKLLQMAGVREQKEEDVVITLPFADYEDFNDCVTKNQDKDDPEAYCGWLKHKIEGSQPMNMPDIADVQFPSMIGAIPSKKRRTPAPRRQKQRKTYNYRGVRLSRKPMHFEVQVLSLAEIPRRLDAAVLELVAHDTPVQLLAAMQDVATYGFQQVLLELHRQGAPDSILSTPVHVDIEPLYAAITRDRALELSHIRADVVHKLSARHLSGATLETWTDELVDRRVPALVKRYASRAINESFILGRRAAIDTFRRKHEPLSLAYRDENGKFISEIEAVNSGLIAIDAVIQTAVMDTFTCDPCAEVDGEVMEFGDKRQQELHPPYVKCFGGDRCRCIQIAILENGKEINVDEIDEDTID